VGFQGLKENDQKENVKNKIRLDFRGETVRDLEKKVRDRSPRDQHLSATWEDWEVPRVERKTKGESLRGGL